MKLFDVRIDNNPGEWKSGSDPHTLVPANNREEAEEKVKNGWGYKWSSDKNGDYHYVYGQGDGFEATYVSDRASITATEIEIQNYIVTVERPREKKLKRVLGIKEK